MKHKQESIQEVSQREQSLWTANCASEFTPWDHVLLHLQHWLVMQQLMVLVKHLVRVRPTLTFTNLAVYTHSPATADNAAAAADGVGQAPVACSSHPHFRKLCSVHSLSSSSRGCTCSSWWWWHCIWCVFAPARFRKLRSVHSLTSSSRGFICSSWWWWQWTDGI